eukprot:COSAG01_NODE_2846_length_6985_cov_212.725860_13_plen_72_part_00
MVRLRLPPPPPPTPLRTLRCREAVDDLDQLHDLWQAAAVVAEPSRRSAARAHVWAQAGAGQGRGRAQARGS